jgi:uncharacterized protein DUF3592
MQFSQIVGIAFAIVGVLVMLYFGRALYRGRESYTWRKTDGYLVQRLGDSEAVLTYTYSVHGVEYTSSRYDLAGSRVSAAAGAAFADHSVGQHVTVWYDPAEPGRAVLVPGLQSITYQRLLLGAALLFCGVSFLLAARADAKHDRAAPRHPRSAQVDSLRSGKDSVQSD